LHFLAPTGMSAVQYGHFFTAVFPVWPSIKLTGPAARPARDNDKPASNGNKLRGRVRCSVGFGLPCCQDIVEPPRIE
jgi:hypothetical protein